MEWKKIIEVEVEIDAGYVYDIELESNHYFAANNIVTHNCRLKNEVQNNDFSYSLGAGGVSTGSKNVITINMNRLVQSDEKLEDVIKRVQKYQIGFDIHFREWQKDKLLPVYDAGFINLDKQYLTLGINGLVESAQYLGYNIDYNREYIDYIQGVVKTFKELNTEAKKEFGLSFNTEIVPAENLGVKNSNWDKADGLITYRDCYNSYFYIVEDPIPHLDKMKLHGHELVDFLDGGSAFHDNRNKRLSHDQYKQLLNNLIITGCNYYCENVKKTCCNACGYITADTYLKCPECGSEDVDYAARVIGYLKKINNYSEDRQIEAHKRVYQ